MLRSIAERVARRIVIRRRLPSAFGRRPFYATPDSALAYLKPGFAAFNDLIAVAAEFVQEGDCVWDIGGNVGIFSFLSSHRVGDSGTVVCVEPDPVLASLIQRSAQLPQNLDRAIHVLCAAVSSTTEVAQFSIAERGRSSNSLQKTGHRTQAGGSRYTQFVPTITLDTMLSAFSPPTFIKIDVEGAEQLVLEGGRKLFEQYRPRLYVEVGPQQFTGVTAILRSLDYQVFDGTQPIAGQQPGATCVFNTLAVPAEQSLLRPARAA
ncbi:MAG: FkbM family methyltransferase [Planctomycetaceae bacterium]|jgi:FkbM family methyltransferase